MIIKETTPPSERTFTIELTEDDAHKLMAILGGQQAYATHRLGGYNTLREILDTRRYTMSFTDHSYKIIPA